MDFGLSEEQVAVQELAKKIFRGLAGAETLPAVEASGEGIHRTVWDALVKAQLLGVALPADIGGGGLGMLELCLLLEQVGDAACPVPVLPTIVMAGLPIAHFGTNAQQKALLAPVLEAGAILTAALVELAEPIVARRDGSGWVLHGVADAVPALHLASRVLVPARTGDDAIGVFVVDPSAPGAKIERQIGTSGEVLGQLHLDGVRLGGAEVLGDPARGAEVVAYALDRAHLGQCALELGLARRALILTAKYAGERQQFGRAIGTFQAVAERAGDAYIDVETIRLTLFRAVWLLDHGSDAKEEIAVAKIVAAEAGHRVVCAAQHIHGGIGFDRDYALYRYFLGSKQNEFTLGSASLHRARLGRMIVT